MTLPEIEYRLLTLLNRFDLRRVLRKAVEIGTLLQEAKDRLPEHEWPNWVARLGITRRTEQLYRQGANLCAEHPEYLDRFTSLNGLLRFWRRAKWAARHEARREARQQAMRHAGPGDDSFRVVHADCRTFAWPPVVDVVATDPPWADMDAYHWLGQFAASRLRPGGIALVQCGHAQLADVLSILTEAGLRYIWSLAYYYPLPMWCQGLPLAQSWRMVLLLSRGKWRHRDLQQSTTDLMSAGKNEQTLHEWQQPIKPWRYWLQALTRPGELIVDPYAGAASIGCAVKLVGGRRYLGTEIDAEHARVAQGRIMELNEEP